MKRTINSTGRKRIPQDRISIRLVQPNAGGAPNFSFDLRDVSDLKLDLEAKLFVEAYVASSLMRFPFGTVGAIEAPADTVLTEVDTGGRPLFRVKVVDTAGRVGKILAAANEIAPKDHGEDDGRKPLLPLRQTDLGEELWRVRINRDTGPEVLVNNRVPGLSDRIISDPTIQGLVLPLAVAKVLEELFDPDEDSEWQRDWRTFAETLADEQLEWEKDPQEQGEEIEDLAQRLVRSFCDRNKYATQSIEALEAKHND
jgi:hypothetical protein